MVPLSLTFSPSPLSLDVVITGLWAKSELQHVELTALFSNVIIIAVDLSSSNWKKIASVSHFLKREFFHNN